MADPQHAPGSRLVRPSTQKLIAYVLLLAVAVLVTVLLTKKLSHSNDTADRAQSAGVANGQQAVAGQNFAEQVKLACLRHDVTLSKLGVRCASASAVAKSSPSPVPGLGTTIIPGPQGVQGVPGVNGSNGANGVQGPQGIPGVQGPSGPAGPQGPSGVSGAAGASGAAGQNGAGGADGRDGSNGQDGSPGAQGSPGPSGPTGPSASPPATFSFDILGVTYTCSQAANFDANAPSYSCAPTP